MDDDVRAAQQRMADRFSGRNIEPPQTALEAFADACAFALRDHMACCVAEYDQAIVDAALQFETQRVGDAKASDLRGRLNEFDLWMPSRN